LLERWMSSALPHCPNPNSLARWLAAHASAGTGDGG